MSRGNHDKKGIFVEPSRDSVIQHPPLTSAVVFHFKVEIAETQVLKRLESPCLHQRPPKKMAQAMLHPDQQASDLSQSTLSTQSRLGYPGGWRRTPLRRLGAHSIWDPTLEARPSYKNWFQSRLKDSLKASTLFLMNTKAWLDYSSP